MKLNPKKQIQIIWATLLVIAGISVILRIHYLLPRVEQIQQFSSCIDCIKFCFYFIGIFLILGGLKKMIKNFKKP